MGRELVPPLPIVLVVLVPLVLLPTGAARSRRWTHFLTVVVSAVGLAMVASATIGWGVAGRDPAQLVSGDRLVRPGSAADRAIGLSAVAWLLAVVASLVALAGVAVARRSAQGEVRHQYTTVVTGALVMFVSLVVTSLVGPVTGDRYHAPEALGTLCWLAIPISIAVAVARYGLYDLGVLVNRTVLFLAAVAGLAAAYVALLVPITALAGSSYRLSRPSVVAAGLVGVAGAIGGATIRTWTRRWFGRGAMIDTVAARLDVRPPGDGDTEMGLQQLVDTVRGEMRLGWVELRVGADPPVGSGVVSGPITEVTIGTDHGHDVVLAATGRPGEGLARRDADNLRQIGRYVAVAADAITANARLRAAERAVVAAQADERRRVRRDLHDGVGPTLAAARLKLVAHARSAPESDLLCDAIDQVSDTIHELRRIVDGLQPSVLEDVGLIAAIKILVDDLSATTGIAFGIVAPMPFPDLATTTAATAYRTIAEAVTNVARHSAAHRCRVVLALDDSWLHVTIADDGRGFVDVDAGGMGLRSIRARAGDAGGSARITSAPGAGTTVIATLPYAAAT